MLLQSSENFALPQTLLHVEMHDDTRTALRRLYHYEPMPEERTLIDLKSSYPKAKTAAVLLLLFEKQGVLRVVLTTRSKTLRTHPGQTALPGGKSEPMDQDSVSTALREAYEECGLDPSSSSLHLISQLPPFLSQWKLLVTPVVVFIDNAACVDDLKPGVGEVDRIFSHPLEAVLDPSLVLTLNEPLSEKGSEDWPYVEELYATSDTTWTQMRGSAYRMHRVRTCASPIKGLTMDILTLAAQIAYEKGTTYTRYAPNQPIPSQLALWAIEDLDNPLPTMDQVVHSTSGIGAMASREHESSR
ncbi:hypothetical protein FRC14_007404 [Serendipita sp. 396]|nr:hypothetical protein FRC14_007404 [Serendipita sp. 396]